MREQSALRKTPCHPCPGIVDQDIDRQAGLTDGLKQLFSRILTAEIHGKGFDRIAGTAPDGAGSLLQLAPAPGHQYQVVAVSCEIPGNSQPNTFRASCDQHACVVNRLHFALLFSCSGSLSKKAENHASVRPALQVCQSAQNALHPSPGKVPNGGTNGSGPWRHPH